MRMIPLNYGGIDRAYEDISIECADKILDMVDDYVELVEETEHLKADTESEG